MIARAAGCEPDKGVWKHLAEGWSLDADLVFDDTTMIDPESGEVVQYERGKDPKRDAHKRVVNQIDIDELRQLCPHRHVVRRSETRHWDYPRRSQGDPPPVTGQEYARLAKAAGWQP